MVKQEPILDVRAEGSDSSFDGHSSSSQDAKDMYRLGKSQELKVR